MAENVAGFCPALFSSFFLVHGLGAAAPAGAGPARISSYVQPGRVPTEAYAVKSRKF